MSDERLLTPSRVDEDAQDEGLRPRRLDDYIGQDRIREQLQVAMTAARQRGEALDHTLLYGPPGLGKTTLAYVIANELGVAIRTTSGPVIEKPGDLAGILSNLQPREVLFIDEIHRLSPIDRRDPLSGHGGLRAGHRDRAGARGAIGEGAGRAVHAGRRDHARGTADLAAAGAVRHRAAAGFLFGRRHRGDRAAIGAHSQRADGRRRGGGYRQPLERHAAHRQPAAQARA